MFESTLQALDSDTRQLLNEAHALLQAAAGMTGEKAEEARKHGMKLLDAALSQAHQTQTKTVNACKKAVTSTDDYVKEHRWTSIMLATGVGVLLGVVLNRR